ncbi:unnamed protein product [Caenorhabditis sp. 36 PRJEB53466]|nr:unnamed protein product [Caenorhabditis sp. 36 PRJEB53466]
MCGPAEKKMVFLQAPTGEVFPISHAAVLLAKSIPDILHICGIESVAEFGSEPIPVQKGVTGKSLELSIEWCEHYKDIPAPDLGVITPWDAAFFYQNRQHLKALFLAANILFIERLESVEETVRQMGFLDKA